jgi:hypothetical protein
MGEDVNHDAPQVRTQITFEFHLPRETRRKLDQHLDRTGTTLGAVIRRAIEEQLGLATNGETTSLTTARSGMPVGQSS